MRELDFSVRSQDRLALYGPNGCGKSTLLYVLGGLLSASDGERQTRADLRTGFVFQDYSRSLLGWYTVAENLELALRSSDRGRGHGSALEDLFAGPPPAWVSSALGRYPYELSGGQRQLIALLRGLIGRPHVLFLDEPFASLDVAHKRLAMELLQRARGQNTAWVLIAHDLDDCLLGAETLLVATGPPLSIRRSIEVPLPWPRDYQSLASAGVQAAREGVYEVLWDSAGHG